jgi:hypothetical protein
MWTQTYNHTQALLWQARKRLDTDDLSDDERRDAETVYGLSQERLDDLEARHDYLDGLGWRL